MVELEIFLLIRCDELTEKKQKLEACRNVENAVNNIEEVTKAYSTLSPEADITAFAKCEESKIPDLIEKIKKIQGVKDVQVKIFATQ